MNKEKVTFLNNESLQYLEELSKKIRDNRVVLFAGAGLSLNARRKDGNLDKKFPLWENLSIEMLTRLYGKDDKWIEYGKRNYLETADKFEAIFGRTSLLHLLDEMLEDSEYEPGEIHKLISRFNWEVITTNFDTLIERGYESTNKIPNLIYVDQDLTVMDRPRIFKINGCIKQARDQIIITGEDFRTFSDKKPLIELYVKKCFIESTVLFVGFSLDDPAFKMIHGWVRDRLIDKRANRFAYSIQRHIDEKTKRIWNPRGVNFIELFPEENSDKCLMEQRLNALFLYLYEVQSHNKKEKSASGGNNNDSTKVIELFKDWLTQFEKKAKDYHDECKLECSDIQIELVKYLNDCLKIERLPEFFDFCNENIEIDEEITGKTIKKGIDHFIFLVETYLCIKSREAVLYHLMKEIIGQLGKKEIFENERISLGLRQIMVKLIVENTSEDMNNTNLWVIAMYIGLWLCHHQKHMEIDFFRKGFSILRKKAVEGEVDHRVSMELHQYWLFTLLLIGPFKCAKNMLKICRKTSLQKFDWDIPKNIHFQLEAFLGKRLKHLALFLTVVNRLGMTNRTEAFHKFLLLENFLKEYKKELGFSDLFIENTYQILSGEFSEDLFNYRNALSEIHYPIESGYFRKSLYNLFQELLRGRSLLCTDISSFILSFPTFAINETEMNLLREISLGELVLLAMIYDIHSEEEKKQEDLKRFMTFMIENKLIDVSYFLQLLLFRLEETDLNEFEQEKDNGILRYFAGLVSFLSCALPFLEDKDLKFLQNIIQSNLPGIKIRRIREFLVQVVVYLSIQLPDENFSSLYETIFSLAAGEGFESPVFHFITLSQKDARILKYARFRFILEKNLDNQGSSVDRDFILFLLNHRRKDIIPEEEAIEKHLELYFKIKFQVKSQIPHFSLQWLMDLQQFIEKGYISLDENIGKMIKEFFDQASKHKAFYFEWKLFSEKMIPVYKTFSHLMKSELVEKIIAGFLKNQVGTVIILNELEESHVNGLAHLLKEIYECPHHQELKEKAIIHMKNLIKEGFYGGGYLAVFWVDLQEKEKKYLSEIMLSLWRPTEDSAIIKAIKADSEFLKYKTDEDTMKELSNRVIYTSISGSISMKVEICKLFSLHAGQNTTWFQEHSERILNLLPYLRTEKDLSLLRELVIFLRLLKAEQIQDTIDYLKKEAPYAEIRRALLKLHS